MGSHLPGRGIHLSVRSFGCLQLWMGIFVFPGLEFVIFEQRFGKRLFGVAVFFLTKSSWLVYCKVSSSCLCIGVFL